MTDHDQKAPYTGSSERAIHPEGVNFRKWFENLLLDRNANPWCHHRDILRDNIENLWDTWKLRSGYEE